MRSKAAPLLAALRMYSPRQLLFSNSHYPRYITKNMLARLAFSVRFAARRRTVPIPLRTTFLPRTAPTRGLSSTGALKDKKDYLKEERRREKDEERKEKQKKEKEEERKEKKEKEKEKEKEEKREKEVKKKKKEKDKEREKRERKERERDSAKDEDRKDIKKYLRKTLASCRKYIYKKARTSAKSPAGYAILAVSVTAWVVYSRALGSLHRDLPEPVTQGLRKLSPDDFIMNSRAALEAYGELGIDLLGDQVIDKWIRVAETWIPVIEQLRQEDVVKKEQAASALETILGKLKSKSRGVQDELEAKKLLMWKVKVQSMLGNLYSETGNYAKAEEPLREAVDTVMEAKRKAGVDPDWLSAKDISRASNSLEICRDRTGRHLDDLDQVLAHLPDDSCDKAILLYNIARSKLRMPTDSPLDAQQRTRMLQSAIEAQEKAIKAAKAKLARNTAEIDQRLCEKCLVAVSCNLAELTAMTGDELLARQRFKEAKIQVMLIDGMKGLTGYEGNFKAEQKRANDGLKGVTWEQHREDVKNIMNPKARV